MDAYTNLAFARVLVPPTPGVSGTSLQLIAGQGARMPVAPFNATAYPTTEYPDTTNAEIVRVTAVDGDVLTILRAQEGTTARDILPGDAFASSITKRMIDALRDASNINAGTLDDARLSSNVVLRTQVPQAFPVYSLFISVSATNPASLLGYGTWVQFGQGRMLVGVDTGQAEFSTVEQVGGEKAHTLTVAEMPAHTHTQDAHDHGVTDPTHNHAQSAHTHTVTELAHSHDYDFMGGGGDVQAGSGPDAAGSSTRRTTSAVKTNLTISGTTVDLQAAASNITIQTATAVNQNQGGGQPHNTLPPYIAVYIWKRTA